MNIAHVVAAQGNQSLDGNVKILQYSFQPNGFTCGDGRAPVLDFYA